MSMKRCSEAGPACSCKARLNIIGPVIGFACSKCGLEETSWKLVKKGGEVERAIKHALWAVEAQPIDVFLSHEEYYETIRLLEKFLEEG